MYVLNVTYAESYVSFFSEKQDSGSDTSIHNLSFINLKIVVQIASSKNGFSKF